MPFSNPLTEFLARIEASHHHRKSTLESQSSNFPNRQFPFFLLLLMKKSFRLTNEAGMGMKTNESWTNELVTGGHSRQICPDFGDISCDLGPIVALWRTCGQDRIQGAQVAREPLICGGSHAIPEEFALEATICMKKQGLIRNTPNSPKTYAIDNKLFTEWVLNRAYEKREIKYQGRSHDVTQNKGNSK
jgi:hypothetical protein